MVRGETSEDSRSSVCNFASEPRECGFVRSLDASKRTVGEVDKLRIRWLELWIGQVGIGRTTHPRSLALLAA
jgi:hypothetical protein